jgi:hypothetical protein
MPVLTALPLTCSLDFNLYVVIGSTAAIL